MQPSRYVPASAATPPTLTAEQLSAARQAATVARRRRAELKAALKQGRISVTEALNQASSDAVLAHIKVVDLLKSMPRVGEKKALRIMERLEIAPNRRIRGLGNKQIQGLLRELG